MRRRSSQLLFCCMLVYVMALLIVSCAAPTAPPPPPQELINQAAQKLVRVQSMHFTIDFTGNPTYLDSGHTLTLRRVEGDIARPDRMRASVKAALPGAYVLVQSIGIGDDQYATNPLNGQWQRIPTEWGFNPALLFQAETGLSAVMADVTNLSALPGETIENQLHYHLSGQIPGSRITPLTGWLLSESTVRFELWVGADDRYSRRIRLIDTATAPTPTTVTPIPPAQWNIELSKFDVPVTITAPEILK